MIVREKRHFFHSDSYFLFLNRFLFHFLTVVPDVSTVPSKPTTELVQEGIATGNFFRLSNTALQHVL